MRRIKLERERREEEVKRKKLYKRIKSQVLECVYYGIGQRQEYVSINISEKSFQSTFHKVCGDLGLILKSSGYSEFYIQLTDFIPEEESS